MDFRRFCRWLVSDGEYEGDMPGFILAMAGAGILLFLFEWLVLGLS